MTIAQKIEKAKQMGIDLPKEIEKEDIVGIYGFFAVKEDERICFYIGKATNMAGRLLESSGGHIYLFFKERYEKLVPGQIKSYKDKGYQIKVEILERVDYRDTEFSRAAHKLALAEMTWIVKYQQEGQCLDQYPECTGENARRYWEKYYKQEERDK